MKTGTPSQCGPLYHIMAGPGAVARTGAGVVLQPPFRGAHKVESCPTMSVVSRGWAKSPQRRRVEGVAFAWSRRRWAMIANCVRPR